MNKGKFSIIKRFNMSEDALKKAELTIERECFASIGFRVFYLLFMLRYFFSSDEQGSMKDTLQLHTKL